MPFELVQVVREMENWVGIRLGQRFDPLKLIYKKRLIEFSPNEQ